MVQETFSNTWFSATFIWNNERLQSIELCSEIQPATAPRSAFGEKLEKIIADYAFLDRDMWPTLPMELDALSPFARTVLHVLQTRIHRGKWISYGDLATACGSPKGARAVGAVMAKNPFPLVIPCHRVLARGKAMGGFGPGIPLKRTLLTLEGAL